MAQSTLTRKNNDPPVGWSFTNRDEMWVGYKQAIDAGLTAQINYVPVEVDGQQIMTYRLVINEPDGDVFVYVDTIENDGSLLTKLVLENGKFSAFTDDEFDATFTVNP